MSVDVTEIQAAPTGRRHSRIPGMDAIRATAGFQRGMLMLGAGIMAFFAIVAIFADLIAPYGFNDDRAGTDSTLR